MLDDQHAAARLAQVVLPFNEAVLSPHEGGQLDFEHLDTNHEGVIDRAEFNAHVRGAPRGSAHAKSLLNMIKHYDAIGVTISPEAVSRPLPY